MWRLILRAVAGVAAGSLTILHAHVVGDETRPVVPLGLDLYRPVPENNPPTPAINWITVVKMPVMKAMPRHSMLGRIEAGSSSTKNGISPSVR